MGPIYQVQDGSGFPLSSELLDDCYWLSFFSFLCLIEKRCSSIVIYQHRYPSLSSSILILVKLKYFVFQRKRCPLLRPIKGQEIKQISLPLPSNSNHWATQLSTINSDWQALCGQAEVTPQLSEIIIFFALREGKKLQN